MAWFLIPTVAVLLGACVMAASGVNRSVCAQNLGTLGLATVFFGLGRRWISKRLGVREVVFALLFSTPIILALTFMDGGLDGVHRWLSFGPIRLHVAATVLPMFLIVFGSLTGGFTKMIWLVSCAVAGLLALQPDACEASGFTAAMCFFLLKDETNRKSGKYVAAAMFLLLLLLSWCLRDRLPCVPYVEGIVVLAGKLHPLLMAASILSLATLPLPFFCRLSGASRAERDVSSALGIYFALTIVVAAGTQRFPVPLLGYGASPIIGYLVALTWLRTCHVKQSSGKLQQEEPLEGQ